MPPTITHTDILTVVAVTPTYTVAAAGPSAATHTVVKAS
jgi:hypothetical protein